MKQYTFSGLKRDTKRDTESSFVLSFSVLLPASPMLTRSFQGIELSKSKFKRVMLGLKHILTQGA